MAKKKAKPSKPVMSDKTARAALWACELLKRAYDIGEEDGGSMDWEDVGLAYEKGLEALEIAKREGYEVDG